MRRIFWICLTFLLVGFGTAAFGQERVWIAEKGNISFVSDAPLEIIKAHSPNLRGVIDPGTKTFAFIVNINSFMGFNSEIQHVHFMENYLETRKYPTAKFTGKLIEDIPFDVPGTYPVRAKGNLLIHGLNKERIIRGTITIGKGNVRVQSQFSVPVADHGIAIPKIVQQKIADQINVTVDLSFIPGTKS